jgi:hypothetical protein
MKKDNLSNFENTLEAKTNAEVAAELTALELEEKQLDLEIKRETVAKIRAQRQTKLDEGRAKIAATIQFLAQRNANQENCNHRKGGIGAESVMHGQGTSAMYAVAKFKKPNGGYMVLCMGCGKEFHQGHELLGEKETPGFASAIQWPTDNTGGGASTFLFEKIAV